MLWLGFVAYGSLVPLDYQPLALSVAIERFAAIPYLKLGAESRADWIANSVLYFPLGALAALTLRGWLPQTRPLAAVGAWACCAAFAVGVEFLQLFFPPRTVSLNDLLAEWIGAALGVLAAPRLGAWSLGVMQVVQARMSHSPKVLGRAWLAALVVLALFPFDVALSRAEFARHLASDLVALWWVPDSRGLLLGLLRWGAEVAVVMPLGLAWAWGGRRAVLRSALLGLALGSAIELTQLLLVSGVAQGASVLSRGVGTGLGAVLAAPLARFGWAGAKRLMLRAAPWLFAPYLGALLLANGWFRSSWRDAGQVATTWSEVRLLPFYYHYYTSEAVALVSLLSVVLMYLPLALWGWARELRPATVGVVVMLLSLAMEASKLLLGGMRPDPTNVLIAAAAATGVVALLGAWVRWLLTPVGMPAATKPTAEAQALPAWIAIVAALASVAWAATLPAVGGLAAVIIVLAAVAVWRRPWLAAALVPLALPSLDFATWSGRVWVDEFDLLVLACGAVVAARVPPRPSPARGLGQLPMALLSVSCLLGVLAALWPLPRWDTGLLADPFNAAAGVYIGKGALLAWIFAATLRRLVFYRELRDRACLAGMAAGLAWGVAVVLWERLAFVSLFDFESVYRVTGPFSAMHRGGAYLEAYLALATAFLMVGLVRPQRVVVRGGAFALLAATGYAMMVTYSRNGYVAWAAVLLLGVLLITPHHGPGASGSLLGARWLRGATVVALALVVAVPVMLTGFARERIEHSLHDLQLRRAHWLDAIALRPDSPARQLVGTGLGRFPEQHYWGSHEDARAATIQVRREGERRLLQLGPGAPTYVEQWVDPPADHPLRVQLEMRAARAAAGVDPALTVTLCEKWMLTSARCETAQVVADQPAKAAGWQRGQAELKTFEPTPGRPMKFTLMAPTSGGAIDLARVSLRAADGRELLANGDFAAGLARWFWTTDIDPPWHIHSLPVALWFELGWVGVVLWGAALTGAVVAALRRHQRGQVLAPVALVALLGFLTSGLVNTLIDTPRFLLLLLLLVWLCGQDDGASALPGN